jgi:hypothetical protein
MKMTISFSENQIATLIEASIKSRFPHENIIFGKRVLKIVPADRHDPAYIQSIDLEIDFGNEYGGIYAPGTK